MANKKDPSAWWDATLLWLYNNRGTEMRELRKLHETCLYIAGPITASTLEGVQENCRNAMRIAEELSKLGFTVICVHALALHEIEATSLRDGFAGDVTGQRLEQVLTQDFELVKRCDAVVVTRTDYHKSSGTLSEVVLAKSLPRPVFDYEKESRDAPPIRKFHELRHWAEHR